MVSHSPQQAATAAELVRELQEYDTRLCQLLWVRWDPQLYRALSDEFDRMQLHVQSLPALAGPWSELLISRIGLAHALWSLAVPARIDGRVRAHHLRHRKHLREVLRTCAEYTARPSTSANA